ncbi:hypothetical protein AB0K00_20610 [Dactylosporangium sp. NPDC049525]|uniref:hypothetical protein n=1 Tax=Dactylosporangium sp. NPDC049525 TaxID=3154730 RepID=UPI003417B417
MPTVQGGRGPQRKPAREQGSNLTEFTRGPWFPLVCVLGVIIVIVLALVLTGTITGLAAVLGGLASVLLALGGLLAAAARYRR